MKSLWKVLGIAAVAGAIALAACKDDSKTAGGGGGGSAGDEIIIGFVAKSVSNPVFQMAHKGAMDKAAELSKSSGKKVTVKIMTPDSENAQKQADAVDGLVRAGAKGIAISCTSAAPLINPINDAVDKGVTVMCFDSDAPTSKRWCYFGTDDTQAGTIVMKKLAEEMGDKGTIAILAGTESAPNLRKRVEAVRAELKNHPNIHEIASGAVFHKETAADAAQALQDTQRAHQDITGWALVGGWPLFTTNALPWKPGEVKLVSIDGLPEQLGYLRSGHVNVLYAQHCYDWGAKSVQFLFDKIVNKKDPEGLKDGRIADTLKEVTKANVDDWEKEMKAWLP